MTDQIVGVVETAPQVTQQKINIKPIGWGWIKRFQTAQLNLIRISSQAKELESLDDDEYTAYLEKRDKAISDVQALLCKIIMNVPKSLIVTEGVTEIDLSNPEALDDVDQSAVQGLMADLQKRLAAHEQTEQAAKN